MVEQMASTCSLVRGSNSWCWCCNWSDGLYRYTTCTSAINVNVGWSHLFTSPKEDYIYMHVQAVSKTGLLVHLVYNPCGLLCIRVDAYPRGIWRLFSMHHNARREKEVGTREMVWRQHQLGIRPATTHTLHVVEPITPCRTYND